MKTNSRWLWIGLGTLLLVWATTARGAEKPAQVAGKWEMAWEGRMGRVTATLTFEQEGEKLKGTVAGERGRQSPVTGTVTGNSIRFSVTREGPRGEVKIEYSGTVEGGTIKGTMQMGGFTRDWTAKRKQEE